MQGVNCTLVKTVKEEPSRSCVNTTVPACSTRDVVRVQNVTEDCRERAEYCQYSFRTEEITQQTVICQRPADVVRGQSTALASHHIDTHVADL